MKWTNQDAKILTRLVLTLYVLVFFYPLQVLFWGAMWRIWLRYCVTCRKDVYSICHGVSGIFL